MSVQQSGSDFSVALRDSIPVMMGYIPLGIVFGFLFTQAGGAWWLAPIASIMIFAGAAQYMMVPMLVAGLSIPTIAFATFVINLRHVFYGISILKTVPSKGWKRWYITFALTDETYSLLSVMPPETSKNRMVWLAFLNHNWWILGTFIGAVVGAQAQVDLRGIDFVLASLFAVLTCEQWRARKTAWSLWVALIGYAVAVWVMPQQALVVSIMLCSIAGLIWGRKYQAQKRTENLNG